MKHKYIYTLTLTFVIVALMSTIDSARAQMTYQPYSYHFYQKLNRSLYNKNSNQHTAIKPMVLDAETELLYDSLMNVGYAERSTWGGRKLWNEHLIDIQKDDYTFYADFIPDFQVGRDFAGNGKTTWLNTRGFQAGGTITDKFFFYTSGYENQGVFADYVDEFINTNRVVPGQMYGKIGKETQDWAYVSAIVSYAPVKNINLSLAYGKDFIGDGYRSMLLSDVSSNKTSFKFNGTFGDVSILSIWSYMLSPRETENEEFSRSRSLRKYGAFQYIDWNATKELSLGIFHSFMWGNRSSIYYMPDSSGLALPEGESNMIQVGVNAKYKVLDKASLYGQVLLSKNIGAQIGIRGFDAFGIRNLNFLGEFNMAQPYTYTDGDPLTSYSNYHQPLAHPFGANFNEFVGIVNYSFQKFDFSLQGNYGTYGLDPNSTDNYGKDIFKPYYEPYDQGASIGQGLKTNLAYLDGRVAYILNPRYNLRLEAGAVFRRESNKEWTKNTGMLTLGLRASFRNLYYDF